MFHCFLQVDKTTHHFLKAFEGADKFDGAVKISLVHHSELQKYLLFPNVMMYNHETCNLMGWYECFNIFQACTCQAAWIGAHLLDVFDIWYRKPPKEPPDKIHKNMRSNTHQIADTKLNNIPSCDSIMEQVDGKGCPPPPAFISSSKPIVYEVNNKLSNRWNTRKRIEYPSFFQHFSTESECNFNVMSFFTHSVHFILDTGTTQHICKDKSLFIGALLKCTGVKIGGLGGSVSAKGVGSVQLSIIDDQHRSHNIILHNVLYVPDSPVNLISPQRWAQESVMKEGTSKGTFFCNFGDESIFVWNNRQYMKTIFNDPANNLPVLQCKGSNEDTVQGFTARSPLCLECNCFNNTSTVLPVVPHVISPNDGNELHPCKLSHLPEISTPTVDPVMIEDDTETIYNNIPPTSYDTSDHLEDTLTLPDDVHSETDTIYHDGGESLDINGITSLNGDCERIRDQIPLEVTVDIESTKGVENLSKSEEINNLINMMKEPLSKLEKEWMAIHYQLKHMPHSKMLKLMEAGHLDKKFSKINRLRCPHCIIATQTRSRSRYKPSKSQGISHIRKPSHNLPGACVSTDQLVSPVPGIIPQIKGKLMKAFYCGATIFVDHHSDYTYVHLMRDNFGASLLEAKSAFERLCGSFQVRVSAYHGDNGRYADAAFRQDILDNNQSLTFCGVGSHHQNGIAERRIRFLTELARTSILAAQIKWPGIITTSLWPFALKAAARTMNVYFLDKDGMSPLEKMSRVKRSYFRLRNEHPLFCPVYVLHRANHSGSGTPKWQPKSAVGIYCGHSPEHAGDVALVMNLQTGHVTPQFHVVFDDGFTTVPYLEKENAPPNWVDLFNHHTEHYDSTDFENIASPEGDTASSHDRPIPEGDNNSAPTSIITTQVQDLLNGHVLDGEAGEPHDKVMSPTVGK